MMHRASHPRKRQTVKQDSETGAAKAGNRCPFAVSGPPAHLAKPRKWRTIPASTVRRLGKGEWLAGALGFEPRYVGTKNRCLTTWRRPNSGGFLSKGRAGCKTKSAGRAVEYVARRGYRVGMSRWDVVILGAGAAGMFCAAEAGRRGRRVLVIDHAAAPGEKIRISGGGRCNFTNRTVAPERFLSSNPRFALSALSRFTPQDFIARIDRAGIAWHEKTLGQLFCDGSARQVVRMLTDAMAGAGVDLWLGTGIGTIQRQGEDFLIATDRGPVRAARLVVATGGLSIPKMGATGLGYQIARDFGLAVTETRPGLVPLTFDERELEEGRPLAGLSVTARVSRGKAGFTEGLLFTHRGLSGPSILQISSYWREGEVIAVDLAHGQDVGAALRAQKQEAGRLSVGRVLARHVPDRLAQAILARLAVGGTLADQNGAALDRIAAAVHRWQVRPAGSEGYRTAEVTLGGVDTRGLDARTMEVRSVPGLYFIGELVDVTGWLGGYNFQWAWSSGWAAGQVV